MSITEAILCCQNIQTLKWQLNKLGGVFNLLRSDWIFTFMLLYLFSFPSEKRTFYIYCGFLMIVNFVQAVGSALVYLKQSFGLW